MAIDSISAATAGGVSPVISYSPLTSLSRPQETSPSAREAAAQENDARAIARSVSGASPSVQPSVQSVDGQNPGLASAGTRIVVAATPSDTEGSLREASAQIARASSRMESSASIREASEAYRNQAAARTDLAQQQRNNGATGYNVLA